MQSESDFFLSSSADYRKPRRYRPAPWLSTCLFNLFEHSRLYALLLFIIFSFSVFVGTLTTYDEHYEKSVVLLFYIELAIFIYCFIEFFLRIYASESRRQYQGLKGKLQFFVKHYLIIDFILLLLYGVVFGLSLTIFDRSSIYFLHGLRFLQLFRFVPLDRYVKSIPLLGYVSWQYRRVLAVALYSCFILLLPTAYLLWIIERHIETNGQYFFKTYTDAVWFTLNSMATIGYGDTWPQTLIGRLITATLCCGGLILWTLPAGLISAGLTNIDEKRRESERLLRPAARLIIAWWRLQLLRRRSRAMLGKQDDNEKCKQFIARLLYARLSREFRHYRYRMNDSYNGEVKKDIDQIFQCLQAIQEKLNAFDQKMLV